MMYFNSVLHPATSPRADPIIDEVRFIPLTEVYQGCKRGPRSVSNLGSYLSERQAPELINMALFARLFGGDRSEVIEGPLDEWVAATIGSKAVATSNRHPHMGASESLHQVLANRMLKKYVTEFEAHCSPGNVGRMLSKIEPWRQKLSNYEKTDEARKASGGKRHGIERIVISANGAFIPESAMAGVSRDGKTLYINENYAHMVREEAELLGVDPEAVDVDTFLHEVVYHIIKKIKGNASGEKQIETEKRDFFKGLLKGEYDSPAITIPGSERSKYQRYLDMVRIAQYRLDNIKSMYGSKLGSLFKAYVMKAIEEGASLKQAIVYAEKRVKEEATNSENSDESDSKDSKSKKESKKKGDSKESKEGSDSDGEDGEGSDGESGDGEGGSEGGE